MKFTTIANARKQTGLSYLGNINSSAKMIKNQIVSNNYTYIIYLAPANTSGYNVCSHSTPECRMGCLNTSGRAGIEIHSHKTVILNARIKKTRLFFEDQDFFMQWMIAEIQMFQRKAKKDDYYFSIRLNGTSDIDWQAVKIGDKNIFEMFSDVQFYDYTKNPYKFINKASNYHLTFSYTGHNWVKCNEFLQQGLNVAMVFKVKKATDIPTMYNGYEVINGDLTDYRPLDGQGVIVGLKWKRIPNKVTETFVLNSPFVIKLNN